MGKSSAPSLPPPPDPNQMIAAQTAANKQAIQYSADVNSYDIFSPLGSVTYNKNDTGVPQAQYLKFAPELQQLFDQQGGIANALASQAMGRIGQLPSDAFDISQATALPTQGDLGGYIDQSTRAYYDAASRPLLEQFEQDRGKLEQQLYDRGHPMGSGEGYDRATGNLYKAQYGTLQDLANQSVGAGLQYGQGVFGLGQAARQQDIADQILQRNQAFNESAAFLQGSPAMPMPQAPQLPAYNMQPVQSANIMNQAYQNQLAGYDAQMANYGAGKSGLFGTLGNVAGMMGTGGASGGFSLPGWGVG